MTKDDRVRFTLRIPKPVYKKLGRMAEKKGIAINSEISDILWQHVNVAKIGEKEETG